MSTAEQRIERALKAIDGEVEMLTTVPRMAAATFSDAEIRLWSLLDLREILLGKENETVQKMWFQMVRERWPAGRPGPGALGWFLSHIHRQDDENEPVNNDAWVRDAQEMVATLRAR